MRIAIIGAGIAGLACADGLKDAGHEVALFDKGRGPGGRMSTRRVEANGRTLRFDHGAQYFTVRDADFAAQVAGWARGGHAARWPAAGSDAWVGAPGMNAPVRAMAAVHDVGWNARVEAIARARDGWRLIGPEAARGFEAVIVAVPAEQAAPLLGVHQPDFAAAAARSRSAPCWTMLAAFDARIGAPREILRDAGAIGWAARDGSKPGRDDAETWVVQASAAWSTAHLEEPGDRVASLLLASFRDATGLPLPTPVHLSAHRWRYARSDAAGGPGALWDPAIGLGGCGDWLLAPRIEAAWMSGRRVATLIASGTRARRRGSGPGSSALRQN